MKLILDGIKDRQAWEKAGIKLPGYDVEAVSEKAKEAPGWVHFGIGNIFRVFIGGIADDFWKRAFWIVALPVWRRSIMMWWIKSMSRMTIWD